ncbi:MAG: TMEM175 family protein [Hyphomicrobiales bacterium]
MPSLSDTFIAYLITFLILVNYWFAHAKQTQEPAMASPAYAWATLWHLLAVTFLPFSMLAVSRYDVAGAVWIYGANMILLAVTAFLIFAHRRARQRPRPCSRRPRRARHSDPVRRAVHDREPLVARPGHVFLSAQSRLSAREAHFASG